jgi:hypothetical protein
VKATGCSRRICLERSATFDSKTLEAPRIDSIIVEPERISRRLREEHAGASGIECFAKLGDEVLQRLRRRRGRLLSPEILDQPVARDHVVQIEDENREQAAQSSSAKLDLVAIRPHLERTENPNLHLASRPSERRRALSITAALRAITGSWTTRSMFFR